VLVRLKEKVKCTQPIYQQGSNPTGPMEFSVRILFSGFEFIAT
jgi:hypothetical protein